MKLLNDSLVDQQSMQQWLPQLCLSVLLLLLMIVLSCWNSQMSPNPAMNHTTSTSMYSVPQHMYLYRSETTGTTGEEGTFRVLLEWSTSTKRYSQLSYESDNNMDETHIFFDRVQEQTVSKVGVKEVCVCSFGDQKKQLTVSLHVTCTGDGGLLPALAIFIGYKKLKFKTPENVHIIVQKCCGVQVFQPPRIISSTRTI